jgi:muramoyltetrapeptide carboxypeptidase LdcA involved in peptidoglycan recycling
MSNDSFEIIPSTQWSDDIWYINQQDRNLIQNDGFLVINQGSAEGTAVGGNLGALNLLQGTEYFPDLADSILFVEDDEATSAEVFDRDLQSLIHLPSFGGVRGIVIGRFQMASKITNDLLVKIIQTKPELNNLPVVANVDFGHTDPKITFPVGRRVNLVAKNGQVKIEVMRH